MGFPTGAKVKVSGLVKGAAYNGSTGKILQYLPEKERFSVHLAIKNKEGQLVGKILSLKPENLERLSKPFYFAQKLKDQRQRNRATVKALFQFPEAEAVPKLLELLSSGLGVAPSQGRRLALIRLISKKAL